MLEEDERRQGISEDNNCRAHCEASGGGGGSKKSSCDHQPKPPSQLPGGGKNKDKDEHPYSPRTQPKDKDEHLYSPRTQPIWRVQKFLEA